MQLALIGDDASPYVTRVLMAARLKRVELARPPVPGGNPRSPEYHRLNPLGKVPGLLIDGEMLPESEVICEFLEDAFPEPPLLATDARERATARLVSRVVDQYISPYFRLMLPQLDPAGRNTRAVAEFAGVYNKAFDALAFYMGPGPFCVAGEPTLGDCALGPYVTLLKQLGFPDFPELRDPTQVGGRLAEWWQALQDHDDCRAVLDGYAASVRAFLQANRATITKHG
jgi:glutathione S-transferase